VKNWTRWFAREEKKSETFGGRNRVDFALSVLVAGIFSSAALLLGIAVFFQRLRKVSRQITGATLNSLRSFGVAAVFLVLIPGTGILDAQLVPVWITGDLAGLIVSQIYLAIDTERTVRRFAALVSAVTLIVMVEGLARTAFEIYPFMPIAMMVVLPTFLIVSFVGAVYVLKETPSPFTGSMFVIIVFTIIAAITAALGFVSGAPQYFVLQVLPIVVAAGVLGSMLRPWRNIITLSMLALFLTVGPALFIPAFIGSNVNIFLFTASATFALACLTIPLSFFLRQAIQTRAATALYISISLIAIGLLAITHANNFAIAYSSLGPAWDDNILFIDWLFGLLGVSTFTMSAISASFSPSVRVAFREVLIGVSSGLLVLGYPFVRWVEVNGTLIQRWELNPLYLGIFAIIIVAFAVYSRIVYQLYRAGSARAGLRFVFFMFAALFLGIVAMFANYIPIEALVPVLLLAGVLLVFSSPQRNPFAQT
jgi:hypothetical protein